MTSVSSQFVTSNGARKARLDNSTHAAEVIEYEHHEIHSGSHYFVKGYTTLANAAVLDFCVETPDTTKWAHLLFKIQATGELEALVYEGTDADADGSLVTPINNNRNSSNTSALTIRTGCTINAVGTLISSSKFGDASKASKIWVDFTYT